MQRWRGRRLDPQSPLDLLLVSIWREVLGRRVGIRDSLASLRATEAQIARLTGRVERDLAVTVPLRDWNPPGTIEALAAVLARHGVRDAPGPAAARAATAPGRRVLARNRGGDQPPFMYMHGDFNGAGFYCLSLAAELGRSQPFYAFTPHGLEGDTIGSIEAMADDHLVALRAAQPAGPYRLGGHCNGGIIAFEMARRLAAQGERVDTLVLIGADVWRSRRVPVSSSPLRYVPYYFRRLRQAIGPAPGAPPPIADSRGARAVAERQRALADRMESYRRALNGYAPGPYGGRVVLLWPAEEPDRHPGDPTQGWGEVAPALEVRPVPGGHHTCLTEHVPALAGEIRRALAGG